MYLKFIFVYSNKKPGVIISSVHKLKMNYYKYSSPLSFILSFSLDFILGGISGDARHHFKLQMSNFMLRLSPSAIHRNMPKKCGRYFS